MHHFSIHTQDGEYAGFFITLVDDELQNPPQSGRFAIKLQSEDAAAVAILSPFEQTDIPQYWCVVKDRIELFFDDKNIGVLCNEYLIISGRTFILTDLTGAM